MSEQIVELETLSCNEVFHTDECRILQIDHSGIYELSLFGTDLQLKFCGLYTLHKKIKNVDLTQLFESDFGGVEIFYLAECDRMLVFDISQILELRELLAGTFAMLQINSLIHEHTTRRLV